MKTTEIAASTEKITTEENEETVATGDSMAMVINLVILLSSLLAILVIYFNIRQKNS